MRGFSVEVQLIEWQCACKKHVDGVCTDPKEKKRTKHREAYFGNFGWQVKTLADAFRKWDRWLKTLGEGDRF